MEWKQDEILIYWMHSDWSSLKCKKLFEFILDKLSSSLPTMSNILETSSSLMLPTVYYFILCQFHECSQQSALVPQFGIKFVFRDQFPFGIKLFLYLPYLFLFISMNFTNEMCYSWRNTSQSAGMRIGRRLTPIIQLISSS